MSAMLIINKKPLYRAGQRRVMSTGYQTVSLGHRRIYHAKHKSCMTTVNHWMINTDICTWTKIKEAKVLNMLSSTTEIFWIQLKLMAIILVSLINQNPFSNWYCFTWNVNILLIFHWYYQCNINVWLTLYYQVNYKVILKLSKRQILKDKLHIYYLIVSDQSKWNVCH